MKKLLYILVIAVLISSCEKEDGMDNAQKETFIKLYGKAFVDEGKDVIVDDDGGFIILGTTTTENKGKDIMLFKTDEYGNELWSFEFGGVNDDEGNLVKKTADGGFIIVGTYGDSTNTDMYLIKTSSVGTQEWSKRFGDTQNQNGKCVQPTADGGFIVVGSTYSSGTKDIYLVKTDASGTQQWSDNKGSSAYSDEGNYVIQKADYGYIVVGTSSGFNTGTQANNSIILFEVNENGVEMGYATYGSSANDYGCCLKSTSDDCYVVVGTTEKNGNNDIIVIKTQPNDMYTSAWEKILDGDNDDEGNSIQSVGDDLVIVGSTASEGSGDKDVYLVKLDKNGDEIFSEPIGSAGAEKGYGVATTQDDGFIIVGSSGFENNTMINLIKTNAEGKLK